MHFTRIITSLAAFATLSMAAFTSRVTYDRTFDNPTGNLNGVACSDGPNGLVTKGFTTFSSLPAFPYIGGVPGVAWNSPKCGSCWALTYQGTTINVLAVDGAGTFNIAQKAMDDLTGGQAVALGSVTVTFTEVPPSACHM
ncbi:Cerato-platanin [Hysterangium stoloniferum]|nr:Cerato-platanin [Hysterangium stoloniferum]